MLLAQIDDALYKSDVAVAQAQVTAAKAGVQRARGRPQAGAGQAPTRPSATGTGRRSSARPKRWPSSATTPTRPPTSAPSPTSPSPRRPSRRPRRRRAGRGRRCSAPRRNLGYTTIKSPVDGVIIDRRVNIGQTVVASLNAPSLFLIAKDLTQHEVWVAVNEADIGRIRPGQPVTFTVDAFPDRTFKGEVQQGPAEGGDDAERRDLHRRGRRPTTPTARCWPYLTANVQFEVDRRDDVLTVPNAALRFTPDDEQIAPDAREAGRQQASASDEARPGGGGGEGPAAARRREGAATATRRCRGGRRWADHAAPTRPPAYRSRNPQGTVWVRDGEFVRPVAVTAGMTDGISTEVAGEALTRRHGSRHRRGHRRRAPPPPAAPTPSARRSGAARERRRR